VVPWWGIGVWSALAGAPLGAGLVQGGADLSFAAVVGAIVLGASVAASLDDPAMATVASMPVASPRRRAAPLLGAAALAATQAAVAAGVVAARPAEVEVGVGHLAALAAAAGAIAVAVAARRPDDPSPVAGSGDAVRSLPMGAGTVGVVTAVLAMLTVMVAAQQLPRLPMPGREADTPRWLAIAAVAAAVACWSLRDAAAGTIVRLVRDRGVGHRPARAGGANLSLESRSSDGTRAE
jgi:hypothetical protein